MCGCILLQNQQILREELYIRLFYRDKALLWRYRALLQRYRALLLVYRALW